jgi:hypothetical protein
MEITLVIGSDIQAIYSDEGNDLLRECGNVAIRRASHVEPEADGWHADMGPVGGPKLGPFPTRSQALEAEVLWLKGNRDL